MRGARARWVGASASSARACGALPFAYSRPSQLGRSRATRTRATNLTFLGACPSGADFIKLHKSLENVIWLVSGCTSQRCAAQDAQRATSTSNASRAGILRSSARLRLGILNSITASVHRARRLDTLSNAAELIRLHSTPSPNLPLSSSQSSLYTAVTSEPNTCATSLCGVAGAARPSHSTSRMQGRTACPNQPPASKQAFPVFSRLSWSQDTCIESDMTS